ncbi:MAG: YraN family protein [Acidobacteriia bacterium]|nr:YraN family protein [Terriglobia bacterium]
MIGAVLDRLRHAKLQNAGRRGEDLAHRFLKRQGYTIVARNFRLSSGEAEADIIAWDGGTLAVVEVKSRESGEYGPPERAIGEEKRRHLLRVGRAYARKIDLDWSLVRFDVVTVILRDPPEINLYRNALRTSQS